MQLLSICDGVAVDDDDSLIFLNHSILKQARKHYSCLPD